jgi:hypothetical protein
MQIRSIHLAQDRDQLSAPLDVVSGVGVPENAVGYLTG